MRNLLLIQGKSHFRTFSENEVLESLSPDELKVPRRIIYLDTSDQRNAIDSGYWNGVNSLVRTAAREAIAHADSNPNTDIHYLGIDEVPALIAFGAYIGDERLIFSTDYDRDTGQFRWPQTEPSAIFEISNAPTERIESAGSVVIKVEVSYSINDMDIDEVVSKTDQIAKIGLKISAALPEPGVIRAQAEVDRFRHALRQILAAIDSYRPNAATLHLFIAAPVSICLATGQELRLRNGRRVQTYRFRANESPRIRPALLLTPNAVADFESPLTEDEKKNAKFSRASWRAALEQLKKHAAELRDRSTDGSRWSLHLIDHLDPAALDAINALPPIWELVESTDSIGEEDPPEFFFDAKKRIWLFNERMLVTMWNTANGNVEKLQRLARAFFWHEYLHAAQSLTQHTAAGVGNFPNCLERIDYLADVYGVLHQVDLSLAAQPNGEEASIKVAVEQSIREAIASFWTFEQKAPTTLWQQRRIRRYLNWYWRAEQIARAANLEAVLELLVQQPTIEIAGPAVLTDGRRTFFDLSQIRSANALEIGLVTEKGKLQRRTDSTNLSVGELLKAFIDHDEVSICRFFESLYEHINS